MGLFSESELDDLRDLSRRAGVMESLDNDELESLNDLYREKPDRLSNKQKSAVRTSVKKYDKDKGPGIDNDFESSLPLLFHETRSEPAQTSDEAKKAPVTNDWQKWLSNPDQYDFKNVDTPDR